MSLLATAEPTVVKRLGIEWCLVHHEPLMFCCGGRQSHNWSPHNALRKYATLMTKGRNHPFAEAGGKLVGVREGETALSDAMGQSTVERIALDNLVATSTITPQHLAQVLRGKAPDPRTGNHPFEATDHPTIIPVGNLNIVADGHHRLTAARARGDNRHKARVLRGVSPRFVYEFDGLLLKP